MRLKILREHDSRWPPIPRAETEAFHDGDGEARQWRPRISIWRRWPNNIDTGRPRDARWQRRPEKNRDATRKRDAHAPRERGRITTNERQSRSDRARGNIILPPLKPRFAISLKRSEICFDLITRLINTCYKIVILLPGFLTRAVKLLFY